MPGRVRRRADDAGRSSLRGEPDRGADRQHHRTAPAARRRRRRRRRPGRGATETEDRAQTGKDGELMPVKPVLTKDFATENLEQLKVYARAAGDTGLEQALEVQPAEPGEP